MGGEILHNERQDSERRDDGDGSTKLLTVGRVILDGGGVGDKIQKDT